MENRLDRGMKREMNQKEMNQKEMNQKEMKQKQMKRGTWSLVPEALQSPTRRIDEIMRQTERWRDKTKEMNQKEMNKEMNKDRHLKFGARSVAKPHTQNRVPVLRRAAVPRRRRAKLRPRRLKRRLVLRRRRQHQKLDNINTYIWNREREKIIWIYMWKYREREER